MSTSIVTTENEKIGDEGEPSHHQSQVEIIWDLDQLAPDKEATKATVWINDELVRIANDSVSTPEDYYKYLSPDCTIKIKLFSSLKSFGTELKLHFTFEGNVKNLNPRDHKAKLDGEIQDGDLILFQDVHTVIGRFCRCH